MELEATTVTWRASAIMAFVLASVASIMTCFCPSPTVVFVGLFFTALCIFYLKAGFDRSHVTGPVYAGLRLCMRVAAGDDPTMAMPRQL